MGLIGDRSDNAIAANCRATLRPDALHRRARPACQDAGTTHFGSINAFYSQRRHSTLGFVSPAVFEGTTNWRTPPNRNVRIPIRGQDVGYPSPHVSANRGRANSLPTG